ncbi:MAG TPA: hypothetical protein VJA16_02755, partial [Thermoanaerobaculia bacterium]
MAHQLDLFSSSPPSPDDGRGEAGAARAGAASKAPTPADFDPADLDPADPADPGDLRPGVVVCRGPRAAEARLLAWLDALAAEARRDPSRLALPVRVVVPSRSLRRHVAARLVRPRAARPASARAPRAAMAGVTVQTLFGLAGEVLERAGVPAPRGALLFET